VFDGAHHARHLVGMLLDIGFSDDSTRPRPIRLEGLTAGNAARNAPQEVHDHCAVTW